MDPTSLSILLTNERSKGSQRDRSCRPPIFSKRRLPKERSTGMRQESSERRKGEGSVRSIWSHLPLFWRFQLAGWAAIVLLTFPLKVALAGSIPGALVLSLIRDGSSFALTLGMWVIYRRLLREQTRYRAIVLVVTGVCLSAGILQTGLFLLLHDIFPLEEKLSLSDPLNSAFSTSGRPFWFVGACSMWAQSECAMACNVSCG